MIETIPDFVEQILVDSESEEQEKKYEMDLTQADYLLMAIARLENKMSDVNQTADKEILLIENWRNKERAYDHKEKYKIDLAFNFEFLLWKLIECL